MTIDSRPLVADKLNPPLDITLITSDEGLDSLQDYLTKVSIIAADCESNMTDDFTKRVIRTIQLGDKLKQYVIDLLPFAQAAGITLEEAFAVPYKPHKCFNKLVKILYPVLESNSHIKIGHNLQFDYQIIKYCLGIRMWNLYDTYMAEKCIHAGRMRFTVSGFWALDDLVLRYTGLQMSKAEQTTFDTTSVITENQITYCALDCRLPFAVKYGQSDTLTKANLWKAVQIECDVIPAFGDMFLNGVKVDVKRWIRNVFNTKKAHKKHIAKLDEFFIPIVGRKSLDTHNLVELENIWRNEKDKLVRAENRKAYMTARKAFTLQKKNYASFEGEAAINYASPTVLFKIMKELPKFKEIDRFNSTDDRTMKIFSEHPTWDWTKVKKVDPEYKQVGLLDALRLYRETGKLLTSFGVQWLRDNIHPITKRVHAHFSQYGADTGRTSCSNPNLQQIPKGKEWRACFVASDEDHVLITMDYNGCELRILAEYSRELVFINAFLKGWDVHSVGAEIVFGQEWKDAAIPGKCEYYFTDEKGVDHQKCSCPEHKLLRDRIKSVNFGIAYGMEAKKLSEETGTTEEQAQETLDRYRKSFPTLIAYLEKSGENAKTYFESRTLAQRRRLYHKPTYPEAIKKATEKLKKNKALFKKQDGHPTQKQINGAYRAMFEAIAREGKNTPIQGSNADMAKIAMGTATSKTNITFMWHGLEPKYNAKLVLFIHDEFVADVHKDEAKETAKFMDICAQAAGAELVKTVPMTTETNIYYEWRK